MVVPPLPALLSDPARQGGGDVVPALRAMLCDHLVKQLVLLIRPSAFGAALHLVLLLKAQVL